MYPVGHQSAPTPYPLRNGSRIGQLVPAQRFSQHHHLAIAQLERADAARTQCGARAGRLFEVVRIEIGPADDDEVFLASAHKQLAPVQESEVAGADEALAIWSGFAGSQRERSVLVVPISGA